MTVGWLPPVRNRPVRARPRATRTDPQGAGFEPGQRAAAGADGVNVDDRHQHRQALERGFSGNGEVSVDDQADVERGPAHVDTEQFGRSSASLSARPPMVPPTGPERSV